MGYNKAAGAKEMDVLLSLRDPGYLQPVYGWVDAGNKGEFKSGQKTDQRDDSETGGIEGRTDNSFGPRAVDGVPQRGAAAGLGL